MENSMERAFLGAWVIMLLAVFFFSCTAAPKVVEAPAPKEMEPVIREPVAREPIEVEPPTQEPITQERISEEPKAEAIPASIGVVTPERFRAIPVVPEYIMGKGLILPEDMAAFLLEANPNVEETFAADLAVYYMEEASIEGVNHDTAFAQMCLETGFLQFGGLVTADMNNFCGLGATGLPNPEGLPEKGYNFPDPRTGVRAHIQHLKAYATAAPLKQGLVDPRYSLVRYGSSPRIKGLSGTWATDTSYANKIMNILERLYYYVYGT